MNAVRNFVYTLILLQSGVMLSQKVIDVEKLEVDTSTNCHIRYYYYPNLEAYYDCVSQRYLFQDAGNWKSESEIPSGYRGYSLFNKSNVAIADYDEDNVIQFLQVHKQKYPYNSLRKIRSNSTASLR